MLRKNPGFSLMAVLTLALGYSSRIQFYEQLIARLNATPGVDSAAAISVLPFSELENLDLAPVEGQPNDESEDPPMAERREIAHFGLLLEPVLWAK